MCAVITRTTANRELLTVVEVKEEELIARAITRRKSIVANNNNNSIIGIDLSSRLSCQRDESSIATGIVYTTDRAIYVVYTTVITCAVITRTTGNRESSTKVEAKEEEDKEAITQYITTVITCAIITRTTGN